MSRQRVPPDTCVGIVANPASGRDIRRLVAGASVFGNSDKAGMVLRVLAGLGAAGVRRALMMPAHDGLSAALERQIRAHARAESLHDAAPLPVLEALPMPLTGTVADSVHAVELIRRAGAAAIVVLGGDGTHRVVAKVWWCGEDKIIYGGESPIWHPQWALEELWNFELPRDIVEERGYPQLTEQAKRKILGENLARLHGIDLEAKRAGLGVSE